MQIVDAAAYYGLLSVQGPKAEAVVRAIGLVGRDALPRVRADRQVGSTIVKISDATLGEIYLAKQPRLLFFVAADVSPLILLFRKVRADSRRLPRLI